MTGQPENRGLARFAKVLFGATFLLVVAGGLVTSTGSGLSVPDWPTTYGWNMFTFPLSKWVGGIRFEHSHRLIAATVGMLTIALLVWVLARERRRWMKTLSAVALAAVVAQGVLGGLTVRYLLPTPISVAHACLAQTFFCLTLAVAFFTSRTWRTAAPLPAPRARQGRAPGPGLSRWAVAAFGAAYVQLVLGAWMRHSNAGLAIPDFPASFGRILPDHWDARIAVAFAHRAWALAVAAVVLTAAHKAWHGRSERWVRRPAVFVALLVPLQILLGAMSIWTRKAVPVTVAHVAVGSLVLAGTAWLALALLRRDWLAGAQNWISEPRTAAGASTQ
jgi:cytochrome c oxidase assembly protein subunit 15